MNYTVMASDAGTKIEIRGEFTSKFPEAFRQILDAVILASKRVEICLTGVTILDKEGARLLIEAKAHGAKSGVSVQLRDNTRQVADFIAAA